MKNDLAAGRLYRKRTFLIFPFESLLNRIIIIILSLSKYAIRENCLLCSGELRDKFFFGFFSVFYGSIKAFLEPKAFLERTPNLE